MEIKTLYSVHRAVEDSNFTYHIGNKQLLYHSSNVSEAVPESLQLSVYVCVHYWSLSLICTPTQVANFVGILSR